MKEEMNQSNLLVFLTMIRGHVQTFSVLQKSITRYTVRIAEDDGEIDTDLPGMYVLLLKHVMWYHTWCLWCRAKG